MWTKVCGITSVENALAIAACGVNAIGLNFYSQSKRSTDVETAAAIVSSLPEHVTPVGLFVNHSLEEIRRITGKTGIHTIQLHGDETAAFAAELSDFKIIRAFRVNESNIHELSEWIQSYEQYSVNLFACLVDAHVDGAYGGSGEAAPWELIADHYDYENYPPLILAGGLTPGNVAQAVQIVRPWGIDTASGVETLPGVKSRELVQRFVEGSQSI